MATITRNKSTIYTFEDIDFDKVVPYSEGGAPLVVLNGWSSSSTQRIGFMSSPGLPVEDKPVTLSVHHTATKVRHPLDGTKWATRTEADRAKFEAGVIGFLVTEGKTLRTKEG